MADEWGVNYRPRPRLQFLWWPRVQFWFVRDAPPLGYVYSWRLSLGPLEIRRWNYGPAELIPDGSITPAMTPLMKHLIKKSKRGPA